MNETLLTREQMIEEAESFLKLYGVSEGSIENFKSGEVPCTLTGNDKFVAIGALTNKAKEEVAAFEKEYGGVVFYAIIGRYEFGDCITMLYVSQYAEDREYHRSLFKEGCEIFRAYSYVLNLSDKRMSDFGSVGLTNLNGALVRVQ